MPKMYYKRAMMSDKAVEKKVEYLLRCEYLEKKREHEAKQIKQEKPAQPIKAVTLGPVMVTFN